MSPVTHPIRLASQTTVVPEEAGHCHQQQTCHGPERRSCPTDRCPQVLLLPSSSLASPLIILKLVGMSTGLIPKGHTEREVQLAGSLNKYLAELLGTFVLIGVGSMAILSAGGNVVAIAFGFGLALLAAIYMFGSVSGAHVNPAVTLAMMLRGQISGSDLVGYIIAQLAGALLASGLVAAVAGVGGVEDTIVGAGGGIDVLELFILEAILTALLVIVIIRTTSGEGRAAPLAIGMALAVIHLAAVPLTGASVNPVRSLGPAIIAADFTDVWIYILAPAVGAVVGVYVDRFVNES